MPGLVRIWTFYIQAHPKHTFIHMFIIETHDHILKWITYNTEECTKTYMTYYKSYFLRLYQNFQGYGKMITVIIYILRLAPVCPTGGWDSCRINFHTLWFSQTILKKTVNNIHASNNIVFSQFEQCVSFGDPVELCAESSNYNSINVESCLSIRVRYIIFDQLERPHRKYRSTEE